MLKIVSGCILIVFLSTLIACNDIHAAAQESVDKVPVIGNLEKPIVHTKTEIAVLEAQLSAAKEFQQHILGAVYWSLGTIVVIFGLLIGYNWFANYKTYERDLAALKQQLVGLIEERHASFKSEFLREASEKFSTMSKDSAASINLAISESIAPLQDKLSIIKYELKEHEYQLIEAAAHYWEYKKVPSNELTQYSSLLRLSINQKNDGRITSCLTKIQKLLENGAQVFAREIRELNELADTLPSSYAINVDALRNALRVAKQY